MYWRVKVFGGDENRKIFREQIIGLLVLTAIVVAWSYFFVPPPPTKLSPSGSSASSEKKEPVPNTQELQTSQGVNESQITYGGLVLPDKGDLSKLNIEVPSDEGALEKDGLEVSWEHKDFDIVFTKVGARVKFYKVYLKPEKKEAIQIVPIWKGVSDKEVVYPFGIRFNLLGLWDLLDTKVWNLKEIDESKVVFEYTIPKFLLIEKTFSKGEKPYTIEMKLSLRNLSDDEIPRSDTEKTLEPVFSVFWGPNVNSGDINKGVQQTIIFERNGELLRYVTAKLKPLSDLTRYVEREFDIRWVAIRSAYFVVALRPNFEKPQAWITGGPKHFRVGLGTEQFHIKPGEEKEFKFIAYIGPNRGPLLAQAWEGLDKVWEFFTSFKSMDWFAKLLLSILNFFYGYTIPNYGVAIILLTVLVRIVVFPLTWHSMVSMKKLQKLAPEVEKIKAEVGDNQQELQKRMMQLYKERGVSPFGGCLPLFLQLPVFIALYRMLWSAIELRGAPFILWITDLSQPDKMFNFPFSIPFPFSGGNLESFNLLPILMGIAMYLSQKLTPGASAVQTPQQKIMMNIMPLFFVVICYNMASGLNLYILVSTLLGIAQNYVVPLKDVDISPKKVSTTRRHFYDIAQEKKRQWSKELRRTRRLKQRKIGGDEEE
ncbi:MAG: YidC/Oxa1 family insertase periplasmic-domain containing protein [Candidatus Hydrogenedentes bacterium]|nr:YidC/Oxa1 family insertase periplasmic-domain containing protein [Candidatus Hydrogenedentota bacterium]